MVFRPLPRSLDPLPDESLVGFFLRLSHRLDITPARLGELTGLASGQGLVIARHQLWLPPRQARRFAQSCRLTDNEVTALCLDSLREHYPPLELDYVTEANWIRRSKDLPTARGWLLTTSSRYCSECLAGDSTIEQAHGGSWRKLWRLAVVFACSRHRCLLRHRCPRCGAGGLARGSRTTTLIPAAKAVAHPAECRSPMPINRGTNQRSPDRCSYRLDQDSDPRADPDPAQLDYLLAVQDRLLHQLQLDRGSPITEPKQSAHHFYDLNLLTRFIRVTWPTAVQFAPPQVNLDVVDDHIEQLHRDMARARDVGRQAWNLPLRAGPPEDPFVCGQLLAFAEHLRTNTGGLEAVFAG